MVENKIWGNNLYTGEGDPIKKTEKEWSEISGWSMEEEPEENCITEVELVESTRYNPYFFYCTKVIYGVIE